MCLLFADDFCLFFQIYVDGVVGSQGILAVDDFSVSSGRCPPRGTFLFIHPLIKKDTLVIQRKI